MYLVVAGVQCQGISRLTGRPEPVGVRHAAPVPSDKCRLALAVCGADVAGWVLFTGRRFEPGHPASCQRCSQLVAWVEAWTAALNGLEGSYVRVGRPGGSSVRDVTA